MSELKLIILNAFATKNSNGNPAGYCQLNKMTDLADNRMLKIAKDYSKEANEVAFVVQSNQDEFEMRYYSPEREVDFCGSATIATMYNLIKNDDVLMGKDIFNLSIKKSKLKVYNKMKSDNSVFILSPAPQYIKGVPSNDAIEKGLGLKSNQIDTALPVSIIDAGLKTLLVPIKSEEEVLKISPDFDILKQFCKANNIDIVEIFTIYKKPTANIVKRVRVFTPIYGILEDPATGSGNSALGYYLIKNKLWEEDTIISIKQNDSKEKFNIVKLQKKHIEKEEMRVCFGGNAVFKKELKV